MQSSLAQFVVNAVWPTTATILCLILIYVFFKYGVPGNEKPLEKISNFLKKNFEKYIFLFTATVITLFLFYNSGKTYWWEWIIVGILSLVVIWKILKQFFPSLTLKPGTSKKVEFLKIDGGALVSIAIAILILFVAFRYFSPFERVGSKEITVSFSPSYEMLNTDGGENVFKNKNHRLRYTIPNADQVNFRTYNFTPKQGEKIIVLREKIGARIKWLVEYTWVNDKVVARDKTPQPYDAALAGDWLVSIDSTGTWPTTLYVEKVY